MSEKHLPSIVLPQPPKSGGFFLPDLVDTTFGASWRWVVSDRPQAIDLAERWFHPTILSPSVVTAIRQQFASDDLLMHVALTDILRPEVAEALAASLETATFVRHHHTAYPLWIAPRPLQTQAILEEAFAWLSSAEALEAHLWLLGWPYPRPRQAQVQVQLSRMGVGDFFPIHLDTEEEGFAVVYNLTQDWKAELGGVLQFYDPSGRIIVEMPPLFNSAILFRPRGAPHGVNVVKPDAAGRFRYSLAAFYLFTDSGGY